MILVVFLGSILHGFFLYHITNKNIQEGFLSAHNRLRSTWEILKPAIIVTNGLSFLIMSIFLLIITIFISHRIIGPMFKISGHLKKVSAGKLHLSALRLRKGDEGQLLCDAVNELQDHYRQHFVKLRKIETDIATGKLKDTDEIQHSLNDVLHHIELEKKKK